MAQKRKQAEPEETNLSARVPVEMKEAVDRLASSRERSTSAEVRLALRAWLDTEEKAA